MWLSSAARTRRRASTSSHSTTHKHASFHMSRMGFFVSFVDSPRRLWSPSSEKTSNSQSPTRSAGLAAVTGMIGARVIMFRCDVVGPGTAVHRSLLSAPFCFCMSHVTTAAVFICRMGIGLGLATFVACQFWMSSCSTASVLVSLLPLLLDGAPRRCDSVSDALSSAAMKHRGTHLCRVRWPYLVPGLFHTIMGVAVMFVGQDLLTATTSSFTSGQPRRSCHDTVPGVTNYRMWCMVATYGFCFGVEPPWTTSSPRT